MKINLFVFLFSISFSSLSLAQVTFQKTIGGIVADYTSEIKQTTDGNFILVGHAKSFGAGDYDVYLIKANQNGDTIWTRTYGGSNWDEGNSILQTNDGGYLIAGQTLSFGAGFFDIYVIKTDSIGDTLWTKTYGGPNTDYGFSVVQSTTNSYYISGSTYFPGGDLDAYLIKITDTGDTVWTKTYGGSGIESSNKICTTTDGGLVFIGTSNSFGSGDNDFYLVKIDSSGNPIWEKTFGGSGDDLGLSVLQTIEGGYIAAGRTSSFGAGQEDIYLIKLDMNGNLLWGKTYGGDTTESIYAVQEEIDGNLIIAGATSSFGAGGFDAYVIKTDAVGDTLWTKAYGGMWNDRAFTVESTQDGGYIFAGPTLSFGIGSANIFLIKTDSAGNSSCNENPTLTNLSVPPTQQSTQFTIPKLAPTIMTTPLASVSYGGSVMTLCSTLSNSEMDDAVSGMLFPNPATDEFRLTFPNLIRASTVEVTNLLGEKIFSAVYHEALTVDCKHFPRGIYFVTLQTPNGIAVQKLIKQ